MLKSYPKLKKFIINIVLVYTNNHQQSRSNKNMGME